ncbi:MAG: ATP-binding protein [Chloroflexia bacterium]
MLRGSIYQPIVWYRWLALVIGAVGYLVSEGTEPQWGLLIALGVTVLYNLLLTALSSNRGSARWPWVATVAVDVVLGSALIFYSKGQTSPFLLYFVAPVLEVALRASLSVAVGVTVGLGLLYPVLCFASVGWRLAGILNAAFLTSEGVIFLLAVLIVLLIGPVLRWREQEGALARYEHLFTVSGTQRPGVITAVTEEVMRALEADVVLVFLRDPASGELELQIPDPYPMATLSRAVLRRIEWDQAFLKRLLETQAPATWVDEDFPYPVPPPLQDFFLRQPFLSAPLVLEGEIIGLLLAGRRRIREERRMDDLTQMAELAARVARVIGWTESLAALRRRYSETAALNQVLRDINSPRRLEEVLQRIVSSACEVFEVDRASVMLIDESGKWLRVRAAAGLPFRTPITEGVPVGRGVSGWVAQYGQPLVVQPDNISRFRSQEEREVRQALCVPLRADNQIIGVLNLSMMGSEGRHFGQEDIQLAQALADAAAVAIVKAELMEKVLTRTQELARVNRELSAEHRKLEWTLSRIAEGVVVLDRENRLVLANQAAVDLLGMQGKEILGADVEAYLKEQGLGDLHRLLQRCQQEAAQLVHPLVYRGPLRSGDSRVYEVTINPICVEEEGQQLCEGVVAMVRDVTLQVEEEQVRSSLIGMLAQDIRTPLTSIKGYLDLLRSGEAGPLTPQQTEFLTRAILNVEQCIHRVSNFLDLSRIQEGQFTLFFEPVNVVEIVQEAVGAVRKEVESRKQELRVTMPERIEPILASRTGLRQVLLNLLDNAVKHTSVQGRIFVRLEEEPDHLLFAVQDSGVGISAEMRDKVFQPGTTGEGGRVGLGLYISKQIVEAHGGRIWFESQPGRGSVFYVTIPKGKGTSS